MLLSNLLTEVKKKIQETISCT